MSLIYFHTSHTYEDGKTMARVCELDTLLPQEGEVKFTVTVHSGKTIFPTILFFQNSQQQSLNPQLEVLGLQ